MSKVHEMVLEMLTESCIRGVLYNEPLQIGYLGAKSLAPPEPKHRLDKEIYASILGLESVKELRRKAEKAETITLGEFEACLDKIQEQDDFVGWVFKRAEWKIKPLLMAQSRGSVKKDGRA